MTDSNSACAASRILLWLARVACVLLLVFWGAFLVEHLREWYGQTSARPPGWVAAAMVLHLGMLAGLALGLWRARLGMPLLVVATTAFFAAIGYRGFPWIALLNLVPVLGFALAALIAARTSPRQALPHPG